MPRDRRGMGECRTERSSQRQKGNGRVQDREEFPETEGEWESAGPGGVPRDTTTIIVL